MGLLEEVVTWAITATVQNDAESSRRVYRDNNSLKRIDDRQLKLDRDRHEEDWQRQRETERQRDHEEKQRRLYEDKISNLKSELDQFKK